MLSNEYVKRAFAQVQQRDGNQPEFQHAVIRYARKGDIDAGLCQIFDQPLGGGFAADAPVECDRLARFEQAGQW